MILKVKSKMAKTDKPRVVWQLKNDGMTPSPAPHGFVARNPVQRTVLPGSKITINLEIQANVPMLAFPARSHADDVTVPMIIQAATDVVVTIENKSQHVAMVIDDKEALVNLHPLMFDGTGEVG